MQALHENTNVRQRPEEGYRRWFTSRFFDVIVWYDKAGGVLTGFQICYNRNHGEKAFTWQADASMKITSSRFVATGYSNGADPITANMATAILAGDAGPIPDQIVSRLRRERGDLDPDLLDFMVERVESYNGSPGRS